MRRLVARNFSSRSIPAGVAVLIFCIAMAALAQRSDEDQNSGRQRAVDSQRFLTRRENGVRADVNSGPLIFLPPVTYSSGGEQSISIAVADVNGDGKPDLLVTYPVQDTVGVLLGNGDGTFQPPVSYALAGPSGVAASVAVTDVNGDGKPDLLVVNSCSSITACTLATVSVLLGNGDGTFQKAVGYSVGGSVSARSLAVADVNGDGKLDVVVANSASNSVGVLLGNGDGSFKAPTTYDSGGSDPDSVAVADVNGDGILDVLVANSASNSVGVLLGNGDGTFKTVGAYSSGGLSADWVAVGDLNGDGKLDVVVSNFYSTTVGVLLGNGDGTFKPAVTYNSGGYSEQVAVADVNDDGKPDVLVGAGTTVGVLVGNGDGTFQPVVSYDANPLVPYAIAIADVNGDGKPDLLVASEFAPSVGAMLNNNGAPPSTTSLVSSPNPVPSQQAVTYTATVSNQSGRTLQGVVTFNDYGSPIATVPLANNQAASTTSYTTPGAHTITATYRGELYVATGSTSAALTEYVAGPSKTVLATSGSPSLVGQPVTFTARVSARNGVIPDGELVTFFDGASAIGTGNTANGIATFTTASLIAKGHSIKAIYAGDTTFSPSTGLVTQVVQKYPTTTTLSSNLNPSVYGQSVTLIATVTSAGPTPTGSVIFRNGSTTLGIVTLINGVASKTTSKLAAGTNSIGALYNSDSNSLKSTSAVLQQTVNPASTSTSITSSLNPSSLGKTVTFKAQVTSPTTVPTGTVTFMDGGTALRTFNLAAGKASYSTSTLSAGPHNISVIYNGTPNIKGSTSPTLVQIVE